MTSAATLPDCPVDRYGALIADGADAATFLQGQLTQDVQAVGGTELALGALLNAQGRVLATPWIAANGPRRTLLLPVALGPELLAHLRRYVLRSKLTLTLTPADAPHRQRLTEALALRLAGGSADSWPLALVRAGVPEIDLPSRGEWIPQMLNLDRLDAISFRKGCYTGQEIVARTQHLGRIKRRMYRLIGSGPAPAPGTALATPAGKVGEIVLAAEAGTGMECLAVVNIDAAGGPLTLPDGRACAPADLPYALS